MPKTTDRGRTILPLADATATATTSDASVSFMARQLHDSWDRVDQLRFAHAIRVSVTA